MSKLHYSLAGLAILGLLACSGGGGNNSKSDNNATKLAYTDPSATDGEYRLVASGNSAGTITLGLHGPASVRARGINFGLAADASKARFRQLDGNEYARPEGLFVLGENPRLFKAVLDGNNLRVSMAQKGNTVPAVALNGVIATVSLQIQQNTAKGAVSLNSLDGSVLLENGSIVPIEVKVGSLTAQ